jgi:hypothetical protein
VLGAFDRALAALWAAAGHGGAEVEAVPGHGAFRAGQIVVDGEGRAVVLDLDGACRAEPARDVGNFLAFLRWQAVRVPSQEPALLAAREAFLDGYGSAAPPPDPALVARSEAASMVKIAGRRARDLSAHEWPLLPVLLGEALAVLAGAAPSSG